MQTKEGERLQNKKSPARRWKIDVQILINSGVVKTLDISSIFERWPFCRWQGTLMKCSHRVLGCWVQNSQQCTLSQMQGEL